MRSLLAVTVVLLMTGTAQAEIIWNAPAETTALEPTFFSVRVEEGGALATHQNMALRVFLDDALLFETESIHEHDALHTFVVVPPHAGMLRIEATVGDATEEVRLPVAAIAGATGGEGGMPSIAYDGDQLLVEDGPADGWVLWDVTDSRGSSVLSAWQRAQVDRPPTFRSSTDEHDAHAIILGPQGRTALLTGSLPPSGMPHLFTPEPARPCLDGELVLDPAPASGTTTLQAGTAVRVLPSALVGARADGPVTYSLTPHSSLMGRGATVATDTPLGEATLRMPDPGLWTLHVQYEDVACNMPLLIVPGPAEDPGSLEQHAQVDGTSATLHWNAVRAGGGPLTHYEFDARVVLVANDDQPGRLVWSGKLHGHGGEVEATLHGLEPGTYRVLTFAGPQDPETAGVATDEAGSPLTFHVLAPQTYHGADGDQDAPSVALPLLLATLVMVAVLRRRRTA